MLSFDFRSRQLHGFMLLMHAWDAFVYQHGKGGQNELINQ